MEIDSDKENYFSLYMKKKKNVSVQKKSHLVTRPDNKKIKNTCCSIQRIKNDKKLHKLLLESSEKKPKSTFSFIQSYLYNNYGESENYPKQKSALKSIAMEKTKNRFNNINRSCSDLSSRSKNKYFPTKILNDYVSNSNYNKNIDNIKNRISNLMTVIDNYEKEFLYSTKQLKIKEQLKKINLNIKSYNKFENDTNKKFFNKQKFLEDNNNNEIYNYYNINKDSLTGTNQNTKKIKMHRSISSTGNEKSSIHSIFVNKNKNNSTSAIVINTNSNMHKNNNKVNYNNNLNKINFIQVISSNCLSSKNSNNNFKNNFSPSSYNIHKSRVIINNHHTSSTKALSKNNFVNTNINFNNNKIKEESIFKRRINYSNFINQKLKQNIIYRNQEFSNKQNTSNKIRYSFVKNSNGNNNIINTNTNTNTNRNNIYNNSIEFKNMRDINTETLTKNLNTNRYNITNELDFTENNVLNLGEYEENENCFKRGNIQDFPNDKHFLSEHRVNNEIDN